METKIFKTAYILRLFSGNWNPITGVKVTVTDRFLEVARRNWHGISVDRKTVHFQTVAGINVDKHLFGATISIYSSSDDKIIVEGLWKKTADAIKKESLQYIHMNTQKSTADALSDSIASAIANMQANGSIGQVSVADELVKLKDLCDKGVITKAEYEAQKSKLLS